MTETSPPEDRYLVPGLVRGMRLLEKFTHNQQEWGLSELARVLELPRSTVFRLAHTLGNSRLIVHPLQLAGEMRTKYLGSDSSRCNRWLISWKAFFATRTPFS